MSVVGIGVDGCDVERMARELAREGGGFRDAVFTTAEVARCETGAYPERRFAACFAAKEAVFKALAESGARAPAWHEIEIVAGARGGTAVVLHGATAQLAAASGAGNVTVSLAVVPGAAVAFAVATAGGRTREEIESAGNGSQREATVEDLKTMIREYVVKEYLEDGDDRAVANDTHLITGGIVDSFSMVSLKRFLERKCGIQIPDAQATPEAFDTVDSIAALVQRITAARG